MPTRWTHSIPRFRPSAALFHSPCGPHQFKTFSRFPRVSLCIVEFVGKNCTSSNTTFFFRGTTQLLPMRSSASGSLGGLEWNQLKA
jgi:hypothetical protein